MSQSTREAAAASTAGDESGESEPGARRFGVVLFDDEKDPRAAWAAVEGAPARRVEGLNDLATDAVWWSNMSYESFFRATESWRKPWLRHDAYLVVKPKDVLQEWGLDPASTPPDYTAQFCSTVFSRLMKLAHRLARECEPGLRMTSLFAGNSLREDLRRLLPKAEFPTGEAAAIMRSGQAFSEFTRTTVRGAKGARVFVLRRPRVGYALEMLQTPLPKGPFEFKGREDLRRLSLPAADRVAWVREAARPCMAELAVHGMEADAALVYGFGNSTDKDKRVVRSWVAHPEFIAMSAFSEMEVRSAWVGREYALLAPELRDPLKRFLSDRHNEYSWCAGVLAETLWRAAALGEEKGGPRQGAPEQRAHTSWRGAWLKAADKTSMFMLAMRLTDMGYPPLSYGYGWVQCLVTEDQIPDFVRDGLALGLVPKLHDVPEGMFAPERPIPWGGDKRSMMLAQFTMTRQKQMLWNLDKLPMLDPPQREVMLKRMIEAHRSQRLA